MALGGHPRSKVAITLTQPRSQGLFQYWLSPQMRSHKVGLYAYCSSHKGLWIPSMRITLADVCPEDYGINPHLRTWGGSRGRRFPPPLDPGATGATAKRTIACLALPCLLFPMLLGKCSICGGPKEQGDSHTQLGDLHCSCMMK